MTFPAGSSRVAASAAIDVSAAERAAEDLAQRVHSFAARAARARRSSVIDGSAAQSAEDDMRAGVANLGDVPSRAQSAEVAAKTAVRAANERASALRTTATAAPQRLERLQAFAGVTSQALDGSVRNVLRRWDAVVRRSVRRARPVTPDLADLTSAVRRLTRLCAATRAERECREACEALFSSIGREQGRARVLAAAAQRALAVVRDEVPPSPEVEALERDVRAAVRGPRLVRALALLGTRRVRARRRRGAAGAVADPRVPAALVAAHEAALALEASCAGLERVDAVHLDGRILRSVVADARRRRTAAMPALRGAAPVLGGMPPVLARHHAVVDRLLFVRALRFRADGLRSRGGLRGALRRAKSGAVRELAAKWGCLSILDDVRKTLANQDEAAVLVDRAVRDRADLAVVLMEEWDASGRAVPGWLRAEWRAARTAPAGWVPRIRRSLIRAGRWFSRLRSRGERRAKDLR